MTSNTFNSIKKMNLLPMLILVFTTMNVQAETLFEGYYKILSGGVHVGYIVQRYDFDPKKKHFQSRYFLQTNKLGGNITESLVAEANDKFQPVSFQYTDKTGSKLSSIDATFKGTTMKAAVSDGKTANTVTKKIPKGTFLSTFLAYLMLQKGYSTGKKFTYSAIAEEKGLPFTGEVLISGETKINGINTFKLLNKFQGVKFIAYTNPKGEVIQTSSPLQQIKTVLVKSPSEATKGFTLPVKVLRKIFGNMPAGNIHALAKVKEQKLIKQETKNKKTK